jgi:hypothetical protein
MGFLRRLIGGSARGTDVAGSNQDAVPAAPADLDALEREHEQELYRQERERLDELQQRQERYAQYAWQPPAQGGERRADDGEKTEDSA